MVYNYYMHEIQQSNSTLLLPETLPVDELPNQFILKVNSRCNLACDYCYMYEMADQSWENQPIHMSEPVIEATGDKLAEYAERQKLSKIVIGYHGGEPLLESPEFYDKACNTFREKISENTVVRFLMQTNGARITEDHLEVFRRWGVRVGFSLDGNREANDLHRRYRNGRSSYDDVVQGLDLIKQDKYQHLFSGILAVIDLRNDPVDVYEAVRSFNPPNADLLLPHGNWHEPPFGLETPEKRAEAPYAAWLTPIFDMWLKRDMDTFNVRTFSSIVQLLAGGKSMVETFGNGPVMPEIVIETDGSYEKVDTLKSTQQGATEVGMSVFTHSVEEAALRAHQQLASVGATALSETCQACPVVGVCGAGYMPHRYNETNGFANPSVYHDDLLRLIAHAKGAAMEQAIVMAAQRILEPLIHKGYAH